MYLLVGTTKQDRYLNEELLPEVDEIMHEVVDHRLHTAQEINEMERDFYRLKLQRYVSRFLPNFLLERRRLGGLEVSSGLEVLGNIIHI